METRRIGFQADALLEPQEALARYFAAAQLAAPQGELVDFSCARGRFLAAAITAQTDYPAAPRSAMDGFAARSNELPARLKIAGVIRMGTPWPSPLAHGCALRIPTGGVVPEGADTVVPIEDAHTDGAYVTLPAGPPGDCVTPAGSDMRAGETVLEPGCRLGPAHLALLATLGVVRVPVFRRPRIAVLSSGDELVAPALEPGPGEIRDSNRYGVAAAIEAMGALAVHLPTARDDAGMLERLLREALEQCDGVVMTGGSSVGDKDLTPAIVARLGRPGLIVHGLRVKPGKPTVLGAAAGKPVIGLPGNPVSALAIVEMVARPVLEYLTGCGESPPLFAAVLGVPLRKRAGWTWFVPARLDEAAMPAIAYPLQLRSSSVSLLARAACLLVLGEEIELLPTGAPVAVRRLGGS
ncbi:MAG: molybdopterin molybdotransferase MoeA [Candidatus Baltobacteraceae bacterium]